MITRISTVSFVSIAMLIITAMLLTSCDNPVEPDEEHAEATGFVLEKDGELLLWSRRPDFCQVDPDGHFSDWVYHDEQEDESYLMISPEVTDEQGLTPTITVRWIDETEDQGLFDLPNEYPEPEWELDESQLPFDPDNYPLTVVYDQEVHLWEFQFQAHRDGDVDLSFDIWHGDHADTNFRDCTVVVRGFDEQ